MDRQLEEERTFYERTSLTHVKNRNAFEHSGIEALQLFLVLDKLNLMY